MKKLFKCLVIMTMLAMAVLVVSETDTYAATKKAKKKVTYTLKKGTLTIKGKGKMPKSMTFKNKKIEKVIIKKGITNVCDYAFYGCKNLKKVKIANTVEKIGEGAFSTEGLEEINLPSGLKSIGTKAFYGTSLKKIEIPKNVKKWGEGVFAFSKLEEVILPNNMKVIPKEMFNEAYNLKTINVPKKLTKIGERAFSITQVDIQSFLNRKSLKEVGKRAFYHIDWIDLTVPKNIKVIKKEAFAREYDEFDNQLRTVTIQGNAKNINTYAFIEKYGSDKNIIFTYKKDYKNAFTDMIKASFDTNKEFELSWNKINDVNGYEIRVYSNTNDSKPEKILKKINVKNNETSKHISINKNCELITIKIRPYKIVNGKKIYGRWDREVFDPSHREEEY